MTILEALVKLRDDLKLWCINNFNNKLNKNLGVEEKGKFLTTNDDGEITTSQIDLNNFATKTELEDLRAEILSLISSIEEVKTHLNI